MLCGRRLGFSGTPSDLLPLELGKCNYEKGSDGKMTYYLTSPSIVSAYKVMPGDWTPKSVLDTIANPPDGTKYLFQKNLSRAYYYIEPDKVSFTH